MTEPMPLAPTGEQEVPKRCAWCGVSPTVLTWRTLGPARVSSPMSRPAWEPMPAVVDARLTCRGCRMAAYGWLVGGVAGEFVVLAGRGTGPVAW